MSSKKLLEQCSKLEKLWPHVFTSTLELESGDGWYNQLVDLIEKQQTAPIWMSETKVSRGGMSIWHFPCLTFALSYRY